MSAYERPINWNTSGKSKKDERIRELESMLATMNEAAEESMRWHKDQNDKIKRLREALTHLDNYHKAMTADEMDEFIDRHRETSV